MANFTYGVARQLDEMLRAIVRGTHPNSFRVLAFTTRRLRGESREVAWDALDLDHWFCAKRKAFARTYIFSECSEFWIWSSITLMRNVLSSIHSLPEPQHHCIRLLQVVGRNHKGNNARSVDNGRLMLPGTTSTTSTPGSPCNYLTAYLYQSHVVYW